MNISTNHQNILILEDDSDQMDLLTELASNEIKKYLDDEVLSDEQWQKVSDIRILKVSDVKSLKQAVSTHKKVLLAILDCRTPDAKGGTPNDQLVKTNHLITGQHNSVDIVTEHIPETSIIMTSSQDRFQRIVNRYYEGKLDTKIDFIRESNLARIKKTIDFKLREYLKPED